MDKLKMRSVNKVDENIRRIGELFPNCVTETKNEDGEVVAAIDFDMLRQELSSVVVEGNEERYQFTWPDKKKSILLANAPISATLRPCREESVDFDNTENLYIEGDNLEVLKLLQETYLGKIKMIYIDPPYNTGNDFVYEDDFAEDATVYRSNSGQFDSEGNRLVQNTENNGRFHTDWLNMLYPRLKQAKDLLADNGVLFISIDENEVTNLKKICDEVFGEGNYIGTIVWKNATDNNPTQIAIEHEYIVCYARQMIKAEAVWKTKVSAVKDILIEIGKQLNSQFDDLEALQEAYSKWYKENKWQLWPLDRYKYIDKGGVYTGSQSVHNPGRDGYRYDVIHPITGKPCAQPLMGYRFPEATMNDLLAKGRILFGSDHNKIVEIKVYAKEYEEKLSSIYELDGRLGSYDLKELFGEKPIFSNPKPVQLIQRLLSFITSEDDLVLDFFSGSASTAAAILKLNSIDSKGRRFICVQLPENLDSSLEISDAKGKAIIKNAIAFLDKNNKPHMLTEIGKERIRRAGEKIVEEQAHLLNSARSSNLQTGKAYAEFTTSDSATHTQAEVRKNLDVGFRVLKLDSSNMKDVYYTPTETAQVSLNGLADNIKEDRTPEDLLFQVMLDLGILLSSKIEETTIAGKKIFNVADNSLIACFDADVTDEVIMEIAKKKPVYFVTRDHSMASDSVATNFDQIFATYSPDTVRKVL